MKTDLVYRSEIWELVGEMAETVRHGSKLEGVMRRYANAIDNAPAVDAIPVEWLEKKRKETLQEGMRPDEVDAVGMILWMWQKEQEAEQCEIHD